MAALALHGYIGVSESPDVKGALGLLGWGLLPYIAAALVALFANRPLVGLVPATLSLLLDAANAYEVSHPSSSTAALGLLWMPFWNLTVVVPGGATLAWLGSIVAGRQKHAA